MIKIDESLAYDIGAFNGDTVGMVKSLGYTNVVCFEPHPGLYASLNLAYQNDNTVETVNRAVSNKTGDIVKMFIVPEHPYLSSLEESWLKIPRHDLGNPVQINVETITLDDYILKNQKIPAYIKIDAEGHEIPILEGLSYKPNMVSLEWISEYYEKNIKCLDMLRELGFDKFEICYTETMPKGEILNFNQCCEKLKIHNQTDTSRVIWGNIWCS